ncbi:mitochondrial fission process protein 1 isoform X1 [Anoplophora glabripennis]|uniref:mitochondrial fission process protein 1 isoform X1 n=1 Tax=Anoplophora glabripennis TaxID=217634 RepID=UPI000873DAC0|nr:mitochondrial fission process protein 1 isoform X1 [Anoplophora glabripennis]
MCHTPFIAFLGSLRLTVKGRLRFAMEGKELDLYRQTPVRYLGESTFKSNCQPATVQRHLNLLAGYSNEVGEAFRSIIGSKWVNFTYAVATVYVLADTTDKSIKSYKVNLNEKNHLRKVIYTTTDTLVWQMLASVALPGFTINRVCALSNFILKTTDKLPKNTRRWVVTGIGLATIPFIIKPIDELVDYVLDKSIRKLQPK